MEILIGILAGLFFGSLFIAALVLYGTFSWGYVTYLFYAWFLLPVFPGLPHLTFMKACGLMFFIGLFKTYDPDAPKKEYKNDTARVTATITGLAMPWLTLLIGWAFKAIFL